MVPPQSIKSSLLDEPSPLGLRQRKSLSLLDLIQMRLSQGNSTTGSYVISNGGFEAGKKDLKSATISGTTDKLKASNFPASLLRIGSWEIQIQVVPLEATQRIEVHATPAKTAKENNKLNTVQDQYKSDVMSPLDINKIFNELDKPDQDVHTNPISLGADGQQDGENAPSERQVSPEKLYRAALLRSRFADTILKARVKMLDQGEKGDPEKLQLEREELERQQREGNNPYCSFVEVLDM